MSALAKALVAAQRRAIVALEKAYVHSPLTAEELDAEKDRVRQIMDAIGCTDTVEQGQLFAALDVIRATGAQLPPEPTNGSEAKPPELASDAQLALIADLVKRKNVPAPDLPLTKVDASAIISSLQAGTYDPSKWSVAVLTLHINCGPAMVERSRKPERVRWCFKCRKRGLHELVVRAPSEPSYYGPSAHIECPTCHEDHADFPGSYRDGPRYGFD